MKVNDIKVTFAGNPVTLLGDKATVGSKAPNFTVLGNDLSEVQLEQYLGKTVVIAVYPSIDTGVCQAQNRKFNMEAEKMEDVVVLSISCDLPFAQSRFCGAEGLSSIITLSDHRMVDFGEKYGFLIKELRLLTRGTVVIDKEGIIRLSEYVPEITDEPNYEETLNLIKTL